MALEGSQYNGDGRYLAVNVGTDGHLGRNWVNLNYTSHNIGPNSDVCQAGGCPSARYFDGWFYVLGGGVDLVRSRNLSHGSWERPALNPVAWGCTDFWEDCSPTSSVARIANGFFTDYWAKGADNHMRDFFGNITEWNWSDSDVDFCEHEGVTYFIYSMNGQGAPVNWTGKPGNFYQIGKYGGGASEWLNSFYSGGSAGGRSCDNGLARLPREVEA